MNKKMQDELPAYRQWLVAAEQKAQDDFDKTVLSLSGGALGVSFVFLKDVIGTDPVLGPNYLLTAWMSWGFSMLAVLASFYLSHLALRAAIIQVDAGTIRDGTPGGRWSIATAVLNAIGVLLFVAGVLSITWFAKQNLAAKGSNHVEGQAAATATKAAESSRLPTAPAANEGQPDPDNGGVHTSTATTSPAKEVTPP